MWDSEEIDEAWFARAQPWRPSCRLAASVLTGALSLLAVGLLLGVYMAGGA